MKILLLDIETFPNIVHSWGLFNQNIGITQIVKSGHTACWAAKWLGEKKTMYYGLNTATNAKMLKEIWKLLDEADAVVHYNGARFDIPTLNKEFVKHGLLPPSPYKQIDLLRTARKMFKFASNKLDYVCQFLGIGAKTRHKGHELWTECMANNEKSWKLMQRYNIQDVALLEKLYNKLLPWIPNHPNRQMYGHEGCPHCSSKDVQKRGFAYALTQKYQRYKCNDCGTWSRGSTPLNAPVTLRT